MIKRKVAGLSFADAAAEEVAQELLSGDVGEALWVVTPNAMMLEAAAREEEMQRLLSSASFAVADGCGVSLAARREKVAVPRRVPGIELGEALLALAAERGERVFFLGGRDGVAADAAVRLSERFPGLCVCGSYWGYFSKTGRENDEVIAMINATRPQLLFVCLGFPMQERWIAENRHRIPTLRAVLGLGGSFDVWAGRVRRAPRVLRALSLEWAWRILGTPQKWRQLPTLVRFALRRGSVRR